MSPDLMRWRTSSYSSGQNGNCVQMAHTMTTVRDSKNPGVTLEVTSIRELIAWAARNR